MAVSGGEVLNLAKKEKLDIILLDLIMPKMDGFAVTKELRSGKYDPNIKIIIFSNLNQTEDKEKAMSLGASGFISKYNYNPSELVTEVQRLVNQIEEQKKNAERISNHNNGQRKKEGEKRILMIEDEDVFLEMFGSKLEQDGFAVTFARNGAWGFKEALKGGFDLFIVDMMMPAMSGEEIVAKMKMEEAIKNTPIIMLSASIDKIAEKEVKKLGIKSFFLKTQITPSELSRKVSEILSQ
ncbi:response regulator [Patescibacteria group bacterium]|nr:response regulator [Patescibacteria group bacterium]